MTKVFKVFVATSSFLEISNNEKRNGKKKKFSFIKNPLKKKLNKVQLLKFAKNCEYIIAGTENYDKDTINKLTRLKCIFRLGSGTDNVDIDHLKKKKIKFFKSITTPEIAVAELVLGYISINANAKKNHKILNKQKLNLCKKNCLIINTSRPDSIDYKHLYSLIKNKKIFGAAIDVYEKEPYFGELINLGYNVILTPHIGGYSKEIRSKMEKEAIRKICTT